MLEFWFDWIWYQNVLFSVKVPEEFKIEMLFMLTESRYGHVVIVYFLFHENSWFQNLEFRSESDISI